MKKQYTKIKRVLLSMVAVVFMGTGLMMRSNVAMAAESFGVSPMNQSVVLNPGESYYSSFEVVNPGTNTEDFYFKVVIQPYYTTEDDQNNFESGNSYNIITDWITILSNETGVVSPNNVAEVEFAINVPKTAPAGGQYASLTVMSDNTANGNDGYGIQENMAIAHIIFAEIAGETVKNGEFIEVSVPSFLLSGNVKGEAGIKNIGNVHGNAYYKLQVFPLFSDEEIYTNEEKPEKATILPDRVVYKEVAWPNTPEIGIFNVIFTVEYEGVTQQVSKMVIKCPVWLMFIIIFAVIALIIWIFLMAKKRREARRRG